MKQEFIEDNIIILSKQTLDVMLEEKNPSDIIGLYCFYYYTAKWQKTNLIKCTTGYVSKAFNWSKDKVIQSKKVLKKLGLIEDEKRRNKKNQIVGWYIKLNYIWKKEKIKKGFKNQRVAKPEGGQDKVSSTRGWNSPQGGNKNTNALSANSLNALNANRERTPAQEMKLFLTDENYPKEIAKQISEKSNFPYQQVILELKNFASYWTELNKSGTKQRWQLEKTFQLKRRLGTWFRNVNKFSKKPTGIRI